MDLEKKAISRLQMAGEMSLKYYQKPLIIAYSGGKDSDVLLHLAKKSGIHFVTQHSHTTADAPETVRHIREVFLRLECAGLECEVAHPMYKGERTSMWKLIPQKLIPPTRMVRYCCDVLKETGGKNRVIATGVRWDESSKRSKRGHLEVVHRSTAKRVVYVEGEESQMSFFDDNDKKKKIIQRCELKASTISNPIIDWTDKDLWGYIHSEKIAMNPLYARGAKRVGCIGCVLAGGAQIKEQFNQYPKYKGMYLSAFDRMLQARKDAGKPADEKSWKSADDVMEWYLGY